MFYNSKRSSGAKPHDNLRNYIVRTTSVDGLPVNITVVARNISQVIRQVEQVKHPSAGLMIRVGG